MNVKELKQGDIFYDVDSVSFKITKYTFHGLCIHPKSETYYLVYGNNYEPKRMYVSILQIVVDKNIRTYIDALKTSIEMKKASIEDDLKWLAKLEGGRTDE